MCLNLSGGSPKPAAPAPAPPPPAPEKKPSQVAPQSNAQAKRLANPNAPQGVKVFQNDLQLPGAATGLTLPR